MRKYYLILILSITLGILGACSGKDSSNSDELLTIENSVESNEITLPFLNYSLKQDASEKDFQEVEENLEQLGAKDIKREDNKFTLV